MPPGCRISMPRGRRYRLSPRLSTEVERVVCAVQSLPYNTVVSSLSKIQFNTDLKNHAEDARRRRGPRPAVSSKPLARARSTR
jgi:hypothetical protein